MISYEEIVDILSIGASKTKKKIFDNIVYKSDLLNLVKKLVNICINEKLDILWFNLDNLDSKYILKGLRDGVDVSWYANSVFNSLQMNEIYLGLKNGVDVSIYANPKFNYDQMREIRLGLKSNVDVSIYIGEPDGSVFLDASKMDYCRGLLERGFDIVGEIKKLDNSQYKSDSYIEKLLYALNLIY